MLGVTPMRGIWHDDRCDGPQPPDACGSLGIELLTTSEQNNLLGLRNQTVAVNLDITRFGTLVECRDAQMGNGRKRRASDATQKLAFFVCLLVKLKARCSAPDPTT